MRETFDVCEGICPLVALIKHYKKNYLNIIGYFLPQFHLKFTNADLFFPLFALTFRLKAAG